MPPTDPAHDLAVQFRDLNDYLHAGGDPDTARQRLVDLAAAFIPGCEWAAITSWPNQARPRTIACSGQVAAAVDQLQYDLGDGPCLAATHSPEPVHSPDLTVETRWPKLAAAAAQEQTPVRGVLSYHLTDDPAHTALNLYASQPRAFDADALTSGALFATHAAVLMAHAHSAHQAATLGNALSTSRQIGAAIGILMAARKITEDDAFSLLRETSSRLNRKLRDIARDVTDTGQLPGKTTQEGRKPTA